jgi:ferric-dicitrate binding protein FerR (iron transport regulator)
MYCRRIKMEWNRDIEDEVRVLIVSHFQGIITSEESERLQAWLETDEANRRMYDELKTAWVLSGKISGQLRPNGELLWRNIDRRIPRDKRSAFWKRIMDIRDYRIMKMAATWLILFLLGYLGSSLVSQIGDRQQLGEKTVITTPLGSKSKVELPDGSTVWLNAGSALEYSRGFNTVDREVRLAGEGFFKVKTDKKKPFVVNAFDISIIACGTTFNVKAYPEEKKVVTTLVDGEVRIEGKDREKTPLAVVMEPKQKVTCYVDGTGRDITTETIKEVEKREGEAEKTPSSVTSWYPVVKDYNVKTELYTSWKDNRWIVEGEKFGELVKKIERRYNVKIILESDELLDYHFSGIIEKETLEQLLGILRLTIPVQYTIDVGKVHLKLDAKLQNHYRAAYNN